MNYWLQKQVVWNLIHELGWFFVVYIKWRLTIFFWMFPFDPSENVKKSLVFSCFQGDQKQVFGKKWSNNFRKWFQNISNEEFLQIFVQIWTNICTQSNMKTWTWKATTSMNIVYPFLLLSLNRYFACGVLTKNRANNTFSQPTLTLNFN